MIKYYQQAQAKPYFTLTTDQDVLVLTSIAFDHKDAMVACISNLKETVLTTNDFERKTSTSGKFLFSLLNNSNKPIAFSEYYDSEMGMENGITNVQNNLKALLD